MILYMLIISMIIKACKQGEDMYYENQHQHFSAILDLLLCGVREERQRTSLWEEHVIIKIGRILTLHGKTEEEHNWVHLPKSGLSSQIATFRL